MNMFRWTNKRKLAVSFVIQEEPQRVKLLLLHMCNIMISTFVNHDIINKKLQVIIDKQFTS